MESLNRRTALRVTFGYRTVSTMAVLVIAGLPPIKLKAEERVAITNGENRIEMKLRKL